MNSIKQSILYFNFFYIFSSQAFVELPYVEFDILAETEAVIRNTTAELFHFLKLRDIKHKQKLKHYTLIHNVFAMITLRSQDSLTHIARLAKVTALDKKTEHFITQFNEVLNGDDKKYVANESNVAKHTELFMKNLEDLKNKYGYKDKIQVLDIKSDILKVLSRDEANATNENYSNEANTASDDEFWKPSAELKPARRIFNGHKTKVKKFPFMASVQFFSRFQCAGSIIKSDLVITAASCLQLAWNNRFFRSNPAFLSVRVGSDYYDYGGENLAVLEIKFHPMYNSKTLKDNLAILKLVRRITFNSRHKKVKKISVDKNPWPLPTTVNRITVLGWGAESKNNILSYPEKNKLSYDTLETYSLQECQEKYSKEYLTQKNFCAGFVTKGGGACNHGVGGPGISEGVLVGVISFGSSICGTPDFPTVFTKLGYYYDWIEEIMEETAPAAMRTTTATMTSGTNPRLFNAVETTSTHTPVPKLARAIAPDSIVKSVDLTTLFEEFIATLFASDEIDTPREKEQELKKALREQETPIHENVTDMETESLSESSSDSSEDEDGDKDVIPPTVMQYFDPTTVTFDSYYSIEEGSTPILPLNLNINKEEYKGFKTNATHSIITTIPTTSESSSNEIPGLLIPTHLAAPVPVRNNIEAKAVINYDFGKHTIKPKIIIEYFGLTTKRPDLKNTEFVSNEVKNEIMSILAQDNDSNKKNEKQNETDRNFQRIFDQLQAINEAIPNIRNGVGLGRGIIKPQIKNKDVLSMVTAATEDSEEGLSIPLASNVSQEKRTKVKPDAVGQYTPRSYIYDIYSNTVNVNLIKNEKIRN